MNHGGPGPVQSMKACVVYDAADGQIHHHHLVFTVVGGREPTADEVAADALRAAKNRHSPPTGVLDVLHIHHDAIKLGKRYRVDVHKKVLVLE